MLMGIATPNSSACACTSRTTPARIRIRRCRPDADRRRAEDNQVQAHPNINVAELRDKVTILEAALDLALNALEEHARSASDAATAAACDRESLLSTCSLPFWIATDDPERGGKMATFVLSMLDNTALVADSIGTYVWALRWKMKLSHQAGPVMGVMHWQDFMRSVRVKAHVPHEPRRAVPLRLILAIVAINLTVHWEVQFAFLLVVMLFTFSRSKCPCPKTFMGPHAWDANKHWMVLDIVIRCVSGVYVLAVRFKSIKQDRRIERPEASSHSPPSPCSTASNTEAWPRC